MVGALRRMNHASALLNVKLGPGAAIIPSEISRIHLEFNERNDGGHMGPRKFWRENLPRLKYWNPSIPMIVNRKPTNEGPATMTLYFRGRDSDTLPSSVLRQSPSSFLGTSPAPASAEGERTVTINIKQMHSSKILQEFLEKTGAVPVVPTPQDEAALREVEALEQRGEVDRVRVKKTVERQKGEAAMRIGSRSS